MRFATKNATIGMLVLALSGCLGDSESPTGPVDPSELIFAQVLGVNLSAMTKTSTGLYYQDQIVGTGAVANAGANVTADYTGWLHNGQQFDTSAGRGPIAISNLGQAQLIAGWNEGLQGMRAGGRRLLVIPHHLGYGATGSGPIPPYATLVFRIDMRTVTPR